MNGGAFIVSLLMSAVLTACSTVAVDSPAPAVTQIDEGRLCVCTNTAEALTYVRARVARLDSVITMRIPENTLSICKEVVNTMCQDSSLSGMRSCCIGNVVIYEPDYAENTVLTRALVDKAVAASLSVVQKRALGKARSIVAEVCAGKNTDYDKALALHDYLITHSTYKVSAAAKNAGSSTSHLLLQGDGVCEGYTRAYGLLLTIAGIDNRYVGGTAQRDGHCWNMARLDGHWVHIDSTYDDPLPDVSGRALHLYFAMSDSQIGVNHTWKRSSVPAATAPDLYYPYKTGLHFATVQDLVQYCATHELPDGYITTYVDELERKGVDVAALLTAAERQVGRNVLSKYTVSDSMPGAFCFSAR